MTETIYLVVDKYSVRKMTKKLPVLGRNEHVIKLDVTVKPEAYRDPTISQHIIIEDWREGVDVADVEFKQPFITEQEAANIRALRLEQTIEILKMQGYKIEKVEE